MERANQTLHMLFSCDVTVRIKQIIFLKMCY